MLEIAARAKEAAAFVRERWNGKPVAGIILGSGLGNLASQVTVPTTIPYRDIPHFPSSASQVLSHRKQLVCGEMEGVPVVIMSGRFHYYEGAGIQEITFPVRVMKELGVELLMVSNASGGLNPLYCSGDIMVIDDHINLMFRNPLIGMNDDRLGPRFPDMSSPYDPGLVSRAVAIARENGFTAHRGVYAALSGPTYETRSEYRMLRTLGADVVGMSTVPEVLVGVHSGLRILALSVVTNMCRPDVLEDTSGQEVVDAASAAEPRMTSLVKGLLEDYASR